jgi:type IV pilus assembly protein PilC
MPKFRYIALNAENEIVKSEHVEEGGFFEAPDRGAVYTALNARGWRPVLIDETSSKMKLDLDVQLKWWVSLSELEMFCKVMQILIKAGITILEALELITQECENKWFRRRLSKLRDDIEAGAPFSESLRKYSEAFPEIMVATVEAGERSGTLDVCLEQMASMFHRAAELKRELTAALTYPTFIVVTFIGMLSAIMIIVPKLLISFVGEAIEEVIPQLPASIRLCFWVRDHLEILYTPVVIFVFIVILKMLAKKYKKLRLFLSKCGYKIPMIGKVIFYFSLVRTLEIFCLLENAGVEPIRSLRTMTGASGHPMIEDAMERIIARVRKGAPRFASIASEPIFPRLMTSMWQSGERAGNIVLMMRQVAEYYYLVATAATQKMVTSIEPIMIISIAFCVGPFLVGTYQSLQIMMKNVG